MLSPETIAANKERFLSLIGSINRPGARIEELINYLQESDCFTAPASTKYHLACEGGWCQHSLNVYDSLCVLYKAIIGSEPPQPSCLIVGLLHDFSKVNLYEKSFSNKKVYSPTGSKSDAGGRFDWQTVPSWQQVPVERQLILGNHEQNSEFLVRSFLPLTLEESSAILHHMGGMSWDSAKDNIGVVYSKYPLALLLHLADMASTYILEKEEE